MPDLDGLELGRVLRRFAAPPQLVFVSAYDSAAVDAFELRALDYLRKPVSRRRLEEALERVAAAVEATEQRPADGDGRRPRPPSGGESEMIAVASARGGSTRLINRGSILYVQSHGDFVRIVTEDGRYLLRNTLNEIERRWEPFDFVRVHRQYVAQPRPRGRAAPPPRRHRRARVPRRQVDPGRPPPRSRPQQTPRGLAS